MDCEQVRASLEAFVAGELSRHEAGPIADHLASCPTCMLEHEELIELAADLRHARDAIRPLHTVGIADLPAVKPRHRLRPVWAAAAALLGLWAAFATAVVLVPSLAQKVTVLPVGHDLSAAQQALAKPAGTAGHSIGSVPPAALSSVVALFVPRPTSFAPGNLDSILSSPLDLKHAQVRLTTLGPVVSASGQRVQVVAGVDLIRGTPPNQSVQHVQLILTVTKRPDGKWVAIKAEVRPR